MQRVVDFLKNAEVYYLATVDGDQPRVRPFGTAHVFEGRLYMTKRDFERLKEEINDGKNQKTYRGRFQGSEGASDIPSF